MKQLTIGLIMLFAVQLVIAQETEEKQPNKIKQYNLIKIGTSLQGDIYPGHHYYYDDFYYYDDYNRNQYPEGAHTATFVAYEHIWEFPNKIAVALEPKMGMSFRENFNTFFAGSDMKLYWANLDIWRMGIALSADYYYGQHDGYVLLSLDNGNYQQRKDVKMNDHFLNFDLSIIPFQFRVKNTPLVFEMQFSMIGLGVYIQQSEKYEYLDGSTDRFKDKNAYPYLFKTEFKIGFVLP